MSNAVFSLFFSLSALVAPALLQAQVPADVCDYTVSGFLLGEHDKEALSYGTVYAEGSGQGAQADSTGFFKLSGLCGGAQVLRFSHVGCDTRTVSLSVQRDTQLTVLLHHHDNYVETVTVRASAVVRYDEAMDARATEQLGEVMERISGVSTLRTGTSSAKPVYDGAFGNRLSLQNNGIAQSGQQWGNDHAPEIDPWVAAYVRVLEGVEALRYAGPTVAATVLIEPAALSPYERAQGKAAYEFQSNGRGNTLNARLSGRSGRTAFRLSGTGKVVGDQRAPEYFLRNTGRREANAALQLARFHNERWTSRLYFSLFNANIGVLRGSHIGNLSDLQRAIDREIPFFTQSDFTYEISPPRQRVLHYLLKAETEFRPDSVNRFSFRYGAQLNDRREYDVRRGGDGNERPALDLLQWDHQGELGWHRELGTDRHLDAVLQFGYSDTENQAGTGVLPLIPDHEAGRLSGYLAYHREGDRWQYHAGLRLDYRDYFVQAISRTPPLVIEEFDHSYLNAGASLETRYKLREGLSVGVGATYRERAPEVNELHAFGLHQGVSGIEEGDTSLLPERSLKLRIGGFHTSERHSLSLEVFLQPVRDYIFLQPQPEFRLTIRGAFPVFSYRSANALLSGGRLHWHFSPSRQWEFDARLAVVRGRNLSGGSPLVYVPADNLRLGLSFHPGRADQDWTVGVETYLSARQDRLDPEQDFLPPPPAYSVTDLRLERNISLGNGRGGRRRTLHLRAAASNIFDTAYRDYLDRQRYFADAPGRSLNFRVAYSW